MLRRDGVGLTVGARNVRAALAVTKVSDRAARVLIAMALVSLDTPTATKEARVYFAGRAALAAIVGRDLGDPSGLRYVDRALSELVVAGYVTAVRETHGRRKSTYRLHLPNPPKPVDGPVDNGP